MKREMYQAIELHMKSQMSASDSAHGQEHVWRVLYLALDIAQHERNVNMDVLLAACLLHDIGRKAQSENPALCHARVGGQCAYDYLISLGWDAAAAAHVRDCIVTHRFRADQPPATIEAKILFDADKLEACGATGIARTLLYGGAHGDPIYVRNSESLISDGTDTPDGSFFHEYNFKLKNLYGRFHTPYASALAAERHRAAADFYEALLREVRDPEAKSQAFLSEILR